MIKKLSFACLLITLSHFSIAQSYWIPKTPFLDFCFRYKGDINNITNGSHFLKVKNLSGSNHQESIIKNKSGLFILIDGTGKVFKAFDTLNKMMLFKRIDSTVFEGYNAGAINYSFHNNIYSLGGNGFWHINGQLRLFDSVTKEWNGIRINQEFHIVNRNFSFDKDGKGLFIVQYPYENVISPPNDSTFSILKFNCETNQIEKLGQLNSDVRLPLNLQEVNYKIILKSIPGATIFCSNYSNIYLIDFEHNHVKKLINNRVRTILMGRSNGSLLENTFELGGKVYYTLSKDPNQTLNSFELNLSDFSNDSIPLYYPDHPSFYRLGIIMLCLILLFGIITFVIRKKLKKAVSPNSNNSPNREYKNYYFSIQELECIDAIIKQVELPAQGLNQLLGVANKSEEVQRMIRSNLLKSINDKFKVHFQTDTDFVERTKSEKDKRYVYYTISKANLEIYQRGLKSPKKIH